MKEEDPLNGGSGRRCSSNTHWILLSRRLARGWIMRIHSLYNALSAIYRRDWSQDGIVVIDLDGAR